jgi:hypothetical protein
VVDVNANPAILPQDFSQARLPGKIMKYPVQCASEYVVILLCLSSLFLPNFLGLIVTLCMNASIRFLITGLTSVHVIDDQEKGGNGRENTGNMNGNQISQAVSR